MDITVNNQKVTVESNVKLGDYLASKDLAKTRGIAIAVNQCVIARNEWSAHELLENDKILIIHATQGG